MVEHSPQILASEEKATTATPPVLYAVKMRLALDCQQRTATSNDSLHIYTLYTHTHLLKGMS